MEERLGQLEGLFGNSSDQQAGELAALREAHARHEAALSKQARYFEDQHRAVQELLAKEKDKREEHHASVRDLVSYLEGAITDRADQHSRELDEARAAHAKLAGESQARDARHESMADRLVRLEKAL